MLKGLIDRLNKIYLGDSKATPPIKPIPVEFRGDYSSLITECETLNLKISDTNSIHDKLVTAHSDLKAAHASLKEAHSYLEKKHAHAEAQSAGCKTALAQINEEYARLEKDATLAKTELAQIKAKNADALRPWQEEQDPCA